jgi:hypothetical protein
MKIKKKIETKRTKKKKEVEKGKRKERQSREDARNTERDMSWTKGAECATNINEKKRERQREEKETLPKK